MANIVEDAQKLISEGRLFDGERLLRGAVSREPGNEPVVQAWCNALLMIGDVRDGVALLEQAVAAGIRDPSVRFCMALAHQTDGQFANACAILEELLVEYPQYTQAVHLMVRMLALEGKHQDALEILEPRLGSDDPLIICAFGLIAAAVDRREEAVELLAGVLHNPQLAAAIRSDAGLARARLLDALERFDEAMLSAQQANRLAAVPYDPASTATMAEQRIVEATQARVANLPRARGETSRPIFILGMPRSGTSLVEKILGAHRQVGPLGECRLVESLLPMDLRTEQSVEQLSARLLDLYRKLDATHTRVTDKQLSNHWHLAEIQSLLPEADVIWCRRDIRDVALSCFFQLFQFGAPWSSNLEHIVDYHQTYDRLMEHWERVLDFKILRVDYEDLVVETPAQVERMLAHVGLDWDPKCLEFDTSKQITLTVSSEQVRQSIYRSSVGRWQNYASYFSEIE